MIENKRQNGNSPPVFTDEKALTRLIVTDPARKSEGTYFMVLPRTGTYLVRRFTSLATSEGGIKIPEAGRERMLMGTIWAVGESVGPSAYHIGDIVVFSPFGGLDDTVISDDLVILRETDICYRLERLNDDETRRYLAWEKRQTKPRTGKIEEGQDAVKEDP